MQDEEVAVLKDVLKKDDDFVNIEKICHSCGAPIRVTVTKKDEDNFLCEPQDGAKLYRVTQGGRNEESYYKCGDCIREDLKT